MNREYLNGEIVFVCQSIKIGIIKLQRIVQSLRVFYSFTFLFFPISKINKDVPRTCQLLLITR